MIFIKSKKCNINNLRQQYSNAEIIDVTSHSTNEFVKLSPFYPHKDIPVPGQDITGASVEGIWQGLKTFKFEGIDYKTIHNTTMKGIKRTCRSHGECLGHQYGDKKLSYLEARKLIYVPTYNWVLEHKCNDLVSKLKEIAKSKDIILLDYNTNENVEDCSTPLSHASLIKTFINKCD